jgi:transposase-like protein
VLCVETIGKIRRRRLVHGESISAIARDLGLARNTVKRALRFEGEAFEDRQDLLGHKSARITTHYSASELANLIAASEKALEGGPTKKSPQPTVLLRAQSRKGRLSP